MEPGTQWFIEGRAEPIATVTSRASVTWHMATSEIPHGTAYYTAPPSAPVGVDDALVAGAMEAAADACTHHVVCNEAIAAAVEYALAQQRGGA